MKKLIIVFTVLTSFCVTNFKLSAQQEFNLPVSVPYSWVSYQAKVDLSFSGSNYSVQLFFVNRIDSLIYLNLSIFGMEVGRMVLTPDSLIFVNKLENNYYRGDYALLRNLLMIDFDYHMIQSLFNGIDFPHFIGEAEKKEANGLTKFVFEERVMPIHATLFDQEITINEWGAIVENKIEDLKTKNSLIVKYEDYAQTDSVYFFNKIICQQETGNMSFSAAIKKLRINTIGPTSITIPDKFKPIRF